MSSILVVDDSSFMRMSIKSALLAHNYKIAGEAENGEEAIKKYKEIKPDVVIMDITMPVKSGIEATQEILDFDSKAKIIILSAINQKTYILDLLKMGAKEFLFKPLNSAILIDTIRSV